MIEALLAEFFKSFRKVIKNLRSDKRVLVKTISKIPYDFSTVRGLLFE
jgi:hypothetical protein